MFFYYGVILVTAAVVYAMITYFTSPENSSILRGAIYTHVKDKL